jgi:hypothetical protein
MSKKAILLILVILFLCLIITILTVIVGYLAYNDYMSKQAIIPTPGQTVTISETVTVTPPKSSPTAKPAEGPLTVPGRLIVYEPENGQLVNIANGKVFFSGQMKDFFEGTVSVRVTKENGTVLSSRGLTADEENYGRFASFSDTITFGPLPVSAGDKGYIEFVEFSMADGSAEVLLKIKVVFY